MAKKPGTTPIVATCPSPSCAATFTVPSGATVTHCPRCMARVELTGSTSTIRVPGTHADEVERVTATLMKLHDGRARSTPAHRPWISGLVYLAATVTIGILCLVIAKQVSSLVLPIVLLGAILALTVVGALQLRHDNPPGEKNFLALMALAFKQLSFIRTRQRKQTPDLRPDETNEA